MSRKEHVHPAKRYVSLFLLDMLEAARLSCSARASGVLPVLRGQEPPEFTRFRNRLKVMAGLDPITYQAPRTGTFELVTPRQEDGEWYDCYYTARLTFTDLGIDPTVELSLELTRKQPGPDPATVLY
jgi:hypothetical protein